MKWNIKLSNCRQVEDKPGFESPAIDKFINQLGENGWQLVSTQGLIDYALEQYPFTKIVVLLFKRPSLK